MTKISIPDDNPQSGRPIHVSPHAESLRRKNTLLALGIAAVMATLLVVTFALTIFIYHVEKTHALPGL